MNGNIRDILNSLSTAVFYGTEESPILLNKNKLSKTLKISIADIDEIKVNDMVSQYLITKLKKDYNL